MLTIVTFFLAQNEKEVCHKVSDLRDWSGEQGTKQVSAGVTRLWALHHFVGQRRQHPYSQELAHVTLS